MKTLWLFTCNDIKSIVGPETLFGVFSALSGPLMTSNEGPEFFIIISRIPKVALWLWLNLLLFTISNQSRLGSVKEDFFNKPWRPIPAKRISLAQSRRLLLAVIPTVFFLTIYLGAVEVSVALMVFTWMYNDLNGGDDNYVVRNFLNLLGFVSYSLGATLIAAGSPSYSLNNKAYQWLVTVGVVIFTTLQMQDLADQNGDRARGRGTLPLIFGDPVARWTVAVSVVFWSFFCPAFWRLEALGYIPPLFIGVTLAFRVLVKRNVPADKTTWKVWCVWTISLYALPLCKYSSIVL